MDMATCLWFRHRALHTRSANLTGEPAMRHCRRCRGQLIDRDFEGHAQCLQCGASTAKPSVLPWVNEHIALSDDHIIEREIKAMRRETRQVEETIYADMRAAMEAVR